MTRAAYLEELRRLEVSRLSAWEKMLARLALVLGLWQHEVEAHADGWCNCGPES